MKMNDTDEVIDILKNVYLDIEATLNERQKRLVAGSMANELGHGGNKIVSNFTNLSAKTIQRGIREITELYTNEKTTYSRIRNPGGGRKKLTEKEPALLNALLALVESSTLGDPERPLYWTCKSTVKLAEELNNQGFSISPRTVSSLLYKAGYSLQAMSKSKGSQQHTDRNAQFEYISNQIIHYQSNQWPVISVDAKKKELLGDYHNKGQEWSLKGNPVQCNTHDFEDKILGKAAPYGVYDLDHNEGWVSVGMNHDTSEFAVESIRRWWYKMGKKAYNQSNKLLIVSDCGGSNSYRTKLWKFELQRFSNETQMEVKVCHFPPGTSKWNKIEHQMFCHISQNWRNRCLTDLSVVVNLISNTKTKKGLKINAEIDENYYEAGKNVSDEMYSSIKLEKDVFHGEWNYRIKP